MERAARQVKTLILLQGHGSVTAAQLADQLSVSIRTVYRDIEALCIYGVPITGAPGTGGGYSLPPDYAVDLTMFTKDEVGLLGAGGIAISGLTDLVGDLPEMESASTKLLSTLSKSDRELALHYIRYIHFDHSGWYRKYSKRRMLPICRQAVLHDLQIVAACRETAGGGDNNIITSLIDPYGLVLKSDMWYLVGYSHQEQRVRRWNLIRVEDVSLTNSSFERPREFTLSDWWEHDMEAFGQGDVRVILAIDDTVWERFDQFVWKKANRFARKDGQTFAELAVDRYDWLVDVILSHRGDVCVLEPRELRQEIVQVATRITQRHATPGDLNDPPDEWVDLDSLRLGISQ